MVTVEVADGVLWVMLYCIPYRGTLIASLYSKMRFAAIVYSFCNFHITVGNDLPLGSFVALG